MSAPLPVERPRHLLLEARGAFARAGRIVHDAWVRAVARRGCVGHLVAWGTTFGLIALCFVGSGVPAVVFCVLLAAWDRADRLERGT